MKVAIINASPAEKNSPSALIADAIEEEILDHVKVEKFLFDSAIALQKEKLFAFDSWIFVFPIYMKGIPAHFLKILMDLEEMAKAHTGEKKVYAVALSKDKEADEGRYVLNMLENFCARAGLAWEMGISGGGRDVLGYILSHHRIGFLSYEEAIADMVESLVAGKKMENVMCSPDLPNFIYKRILKREMKTIKKNLK